MALAGPKVASGVITRGSDEAVTGEGSPRGPTESSRGYLSTAAREGGRRGGAGAPPSAVQPKCGVQTEGLHICGISAKAWLACVSLFFYFVLFLEASLLRVRGRTGSDSWGAQRSFSSDTSPTPRPARLPSPAALQVVRRRMLGINCAICWPGAMGASQLVCLIRDTVTDKYKLSEDQNTRENNSHP